MNTDREENHGEYWPSPFAITFNVKKVWAWLVSLFLLAGVAQAQVSYCGVDVAKDFVPYGGVAKQTLSNMVIYSEQLDNAAWTKHGGVTVITANSITAPDGALTADLATLSAATTSARYIYPTASITVVNGSTYRQSTYLKAGTHSYVEYYSQTPATAFVDVDLATCTTLRVGSTTLSSASFSVGNGWCYVSFTYVSNNVVASPTFLPLKDAVSSAATSWTSTGAETYYIWGASFQLASAPADYIPTTTTALTLGPLCPVGYTQSLTDPSRCFIVGPVTSRTIRTW